MTNEDLDAVTRVLGEDVDALLADACNLFNKIRRVVEKLEHDTDYNELFGRPASAVIDAGIQEVLAHMRTYEHRLVNECENEIDDPLLGPDKPECDLVVRGRLGELTPIKDRRILASETEEEQLRQEHDGYVCDWDEKLRDL